MCVLQFISPTLMAPRVLILVLIPISAAGTQQVVQQFSPKRAAIELIAQQ